MQPLRDADQSAGHLAGVVICGRMQRPFQKRARAFLGRVLLGLGNQPRMEKRHGWGV